MEKVTLNDIVGAGAYEQKRDAFRREIIDLKKHRRVAVGDKVSLVFENRTTVIFQIQEMLRAESIRDLDKIREEIDVYNELVPGAGELRATLFLEIENQTNLRGELLKFLGIDERVFLCMGADRSVRASFEEGHSKEDKISAVQYVTFDLTPDDVEALREADARIVVDHENYHAEAVLSETTKAELLQDLG
ncbi:MAG: DUF3501 family protein [Deltaproteobacteria bacterium]|nr:DUF3501 family protein [Deltaproteobacteria bacterium]